MSSVTEVTKNDKVLTKDKEKSQCEFIAKNGKNKGIQCKKTARTKIIVDGNEKTICAQHNPKYRESQAQNKRIRLAAKRNAEVNKVEKVTEVTEVTKVECKIECSADSVDDSTESTD